uniref:Uncharacterized protein n=1 Tax=Mola mola TaxID=94237 RepID=A0A3Q3WTN4_MOLML
TNTMSTSLFREFLVSNLMPEKCYQHLFVDARLHGEDPGCETLKRLRCFSLLFTYPAAQLPQLLKILWRRSALGLSLRSAVLQLYAISCSVEYAVAKNFPLYAWGERLLMLVQVAAIVFLILHYRGKTRRGLLFLLAYGGVMLLLGSHASAAVVSLMHDTSLPALIGFQARTNYCNGHTGQLSTLTVLLSWAGSLGVAFTSLQVLHCRKSAVQLICTWHKQPKAQLKQSKLPKIQGAIQPI